MLAAHDAGDGFDAIVIGDDAHVAARRIGLAVERQNLVAFAGAADDEIARDLLRVKHMQRAALVEGDVIGDVHQRVDRAQANRLQPVLHPFRRGPVGDAAHEAQREAGAEVRRFDVSR